MTRAVAPPLRLVLRASHSLRVAVVVLAVLAALALYLSALSDVVILLLPVLAWWAWRGLAAGLPTSLVLRGDGSAVRLKGDGEEQPVQALALHERGPFGTLAMDIDGRRRDLAWAADSLPRTMRRELRLWMRDHVHHPDGRAPDASSPGNTTSPG